MLWRRCEISGCREQAYHKAGDTARRRLRCGCGNPSSVCRSCDGMCHGGCGGARPWAGSLPCRLWAASRRRGRAWTRPKSMTHRRVASRPGASPQHLFAWQRRGLPSLSRCRLAYHPCCPLIRLLPCGNQAWDLMADALKEDPMVRNQHITDSDVNTSGSGCGLTAPTP